MSTELTTYNDIDYLEEVMKTRFGFKDEGDDSTDDLYSKYWMGQLPNHNRDLITLASYRRAVARFVKIATRKNIPVVFNTKGHSYVTDKENKVVLSAVCKNKDFDSAVGLALHESSHILWTDWDAIKNLMNTYDCKKPWVMPQDIQDEFARLGTIHGSVIREVVKSFENYIEDRRIDDLMIKMIPGYEPYYKALYKKYFGAPIISAGLKSSYYREPTPEAYGFRIVNHINPDSDPKALPGLEEIIKLIDVPNISRLKNTQEVIDVAIEVTRIMIKNIPTPEPEKDDQDENNEGESDETQDGNGSGESGSQEENDPKDDYEDAGDLDDSDPSGGSPAPNDDPNAEPKSDDKNDDVSPEDGNSPNDENDDSNENGGDETDDSDNGSGNEESNDEPEDGDESDENSKGGNADGKDEDIDENNDNNESIDGNESDDGDEETDDESDSTDGESTDSESEDGDSDNDDMTADTDDLTSEDEIEDDEPEEELEDLSKDEEKKLEKVLKTQSDLLEGEVKKNELSKKDAKTLKNIEDAGTTVEHVQGDSKNGVDVYVVRKLNKDIMTTFNISKKSWVGKSVNEKGFEAEIFDESQRAVLKGTRLGKILAKKLQVRNETKVYRSKRKTSGKIDRRLLHQLGIGTSQIFEKINKDQYGNAVVHITIDASSSMNGDPWENTMTSAVAIAYAATQVENLEVIISFRGTFNRLVKLPTKKNSYGEYEYVPLMVIGYDSRKDKFKKIQQLFPYIKTFGITPEGLCYEAVMKDILISMSGKDGYFINFSDGYPNMVNVKIPEYKRMNAYEIAKFNVDKIRNNGIRVLSFYLTDEDEDNPDLTKFKFMYGKDAVNIDVTQVVPLARELNKLFLRK
jgi:hypothetical protein